MLPCLAESPSIPIYAETRKAFIFSLKNSEDLPPFKCLAKGEGNAIYKNSVYGPSFGNGPYFYIDKSNSMAEIDEPYSAPREVAIKETVFTGIRGTFSPDNYEVFYLA